MTMWWCRVRSREGGSAEPAQQQPPHGGYGGALGPDWLKTMGLAHDLTRDSERHHRYDGHHDSSSQAAAEGASQQEQQPGASGDGAPGGQGQGQQQGGSGPSTTEGAGVLTIAFGREVQVSEERPAAAAAAAGDGVGLLSLEEGGRGGTSTQACGAHAVCCFGQGLSEQGPAAAAGAGGRSSPAAPAWPLYVTMTGGETWGCDFVVRASTRRRNGCHNAHQQLSLPGGRRRVLLRLTSGPALLSRRAWLLSGVSDGRGACGGLPGARVREGRGRRGQGQPAHADHG